MLRRIGVTQHHLLTISAKFDQTAIRGVGKHVGKDLARSVHLTSRLEQGDEADASHTRGEIDEPGVTSKHGDRKHVRGAGRFRHDVGLDDPIAEPIQRSAYRFE